ncbi:MAG: hypothetical protein LBG14_01530 [Treponema sp.]|jgi:hypothetical protein|nr:hypothetical protein [Treponema sp.]
MKRRLAFLLLIFLCASTAYSQSSSSLGIPVAAAEPKKPVFPRWVLDLRRAEIVAFGAFPFAMFFSIFAMDTYRSATHDWDSRYYPWPMKGPGAIEMDTDEHMLTLGIAAAGSLAVALADHIIVQVKRARAEKQRLELPEGDLIILRKPWPPETEAAGDDAPGETAPDQGSGAETEADSAP